MGSESYEGKIRGTLANQTYASYFHVDCPAVVSGSSGFAEERAGLVCKGKMCRALHNTWKRKSGSSSYRAR